MTGNDDVQRRRRGAGAPWWAPRLATWAVLGVLAAALGTAGAQPTSGGEVRLAAASTPALSADERAVLALMDPADRARYLLQKRIQEQAEVAALLSEIQAARHDTARSVINNIR